MGQGGLKVHVVGQDARHGVPEAGMQQCIGTPAARVTSRTLDRLHLWTHSEPCILLVTVLEQFRWLPLADRWVVRCPRDLGTRYCAAHQDFHTGLLGAAVAPSD